MIQTSQDVKQSPRTLEEFLAWELNDGFKYEWNDGEIIKTENMNRKLLFLIGKLYQLFHKTAAFRDGGLLLAEQDVMLSGIQLRRPDLAFFSLSQIQKSPDGEDPIPEFVIEIISSYDQINQLEKKIAEYFKAGVKVIWNIIPEQEVVYVYTSRRDVKICLENDICSASPVLPDFEISVNELFALPMV